MNSKLTASEISELKSYTGSGYFNLNSKMRSCPPEFECLGKELKEKADKILSAIAKAGKFSTPIKVHRGLSVDQSTLKTFIDTTLKHQNDGTTYQFPSFTSTSVTSGFHGNVKFHITAKTGIFVKSLSGFKSENEVIQSPHTKYKVTEVTKSPTSHSTSSTYHVNLEEV